MEWRTRWHITIRWDRADNSPVGVTVVERVVDSSAELRRLVDRARADPVGLENRVTAAELRFCVSSVPAWPTRWKP